MNKGSVGRIWILLCGMNVGGAIAIGVDVSVAIALAGSSSGADAGRLSAQCRGQNHIQRVHKRNQEVEGPVRLSLDIDTELTVLRENADRSRHLLVHSVTTYTSKGSAGFQGPKVDAGVSE